MKKKKLLIFTCLLLVLTLMLCSLAGCQKFKLSNLENKDYAAEDDTLKVKTLSALSGYDFSSVNQGFIVAEKKDAENKFSEIVLYNAHSEKILLSVKENFDAYTFEYYEGVAIVRNTLTDHTDVFDKNGAVLSADNTKLSSTTTNGYFRYLYFSNAKTVTIDIESGVAKVKDTQIGGEPSNLVKFGDHYFESIGGESGFVLAIYDKNMNFQRYFDIESQIDMTSADADATTAMLRDGRILMTLASSLPDDATSYDFINEGTKYVNRSYIIDLNSLSVTKVEPKYFISGMADESFNYNILYFQDLSDKTMSSAFSLGVFDDDLNLLFNLSDYLADIDSVEVLDNGDIKLKNRDLALILDKNGNTVASYYTEGVTDYGPFLMKLDGNTKSFYDQYGKEIFTLDSEGNIVTSLESSRYIYYTETIEVSSEGASEIHLMAYDTETKTSKDLGLYSSISFNSSINAYTVTATTDNGTVKSLYSGEDGKAIFENLTDPVISSYSSGSDRLMTVTVDGSTTFYYFYR